MAKTSSPHPIRVVLKLPRKVADFIVHAQLVHDTMAANATTLPDANPVLAVLATHIGDLVTKEVAAKSRAAGAVADRDAAMKLVAGDLSSERAYVEGVVNANPGSAATIAQDAGMSLRKVPSYNKVDLATRKGAVSGTVHVIAKATKGAKANLWQYSLDGGKTWIDLPPTTRAQTSVANLTPLTTVSFRQRVLTKVGLSDWGPPISALVM